MDYDKLATFLHVCDAGGFTKAANKHFRSQSAISQQIQLLERELGLILILRKKGGIQLTPGGAALARALRNGLSQIDDAVAKLTDTSSMVEASIRIGVIADFGSERVVGTVAKLKALYPNVNLNFVFKNTSREVEAAFERDEVDFGVMIFFRNPEQFEIRKLDEIRNALAASPAYLRKTKIRSVPDLVGADLIDFTTDFTAIGAWMRTYEPGALKELRERKPIAIVPSQTAVRELVKAGIGVGVLQPRLFRKEFERGELVEVMPRKGRPFMVGIHLAYKKGRRLRAFEEKFVELLFAPPEKK